MPTAKNGVIDRGLSSGEHPPSSEQAVEERALVPAAGITLDRHTAAVLSPAQHEEYRQLRHDERRLVTVESLERWTRDLHEDDYTLAEVARLERARQTAIRTMRDGVLLTDLEMRLVRYLQRHEGKTMSYIQIARHLWGTRDHPVTARMLASQHGYQAPMVAHIQVMMCNVRKRLEIDPLRPQHFATVRGVGYRFYSQPPALDDGEDYETRASESSRQREQMQREFGLIEGEFVAFKTADGYETRELPDPENPDQSRALPAPFVPVDPAL